MIIDLPYQVMEEDPEVSLSSFKCKVPNSFAGSAEAHVTHAQFMMIDLKAPTNKHKKRKIKWSTAYDSDATKVILVEEEEDDDDSTDDEGSSSLGESNVNRETLDKRLTKAKAKSIENKMKLDEMLARVGMKKTWMNKPW